jgi:anthranilate phosphoribosyltransferase
VAPTRIVEVNGEVISAYTVTPQQLGVDPRAGEPPAGGTPEQNAQVTRAVLAGERGGARELALINGAAAIYAAGAAPSLDDALELAREAVDTGAAAAALERFVAATRELS